MELVQIHAPDLVVVDVMMPGMSGWEVCKRLKSPGSNGSFAHTGVIMLTGIGENLNDMTSPLFHADAWLNKPFDFADLDARVSETLKRYRGAGPIDDINVPRDIGASPTHASEAKPHAPRRQKVARSLDQPKKVAAVRAGTSTPKAQATKAKKKDGKPTTVSSAIGRKRKAVKSS